MTPTPLFPWHRLRLTLLTSAYLGLALALTLAPGVRAESVEEDPVGFEPVGFEPVGFEDLAGVLDVEGQALYVLPDDHDSVLEVLGAEPADDGWYSMTHQVTELLPSGLGVSLTPSTVLFQVFFSDGFESDGTPRGVSHVDKQGHYYRVYRDAACTSSPGAPREWTLSACEAIAWPAGLSNSRRRQEGPFGNCQRWWGSLCVERIEPIRIEFFYRDTDCNFFVGARPTTALACRL